MAGRWSDLDRRLNDWRRAVVDCLTGMTGDAVVFSHFVAINVAVGSAEGDDRLVVFSPDNGSITRLANEGGRLAVLELGRTVAHTRVN